MTSRDTPIRCEFCGRVREMRCLGKASSLEMFIPKPCDCAEAIAARDEADRRERERDAREAAQARERKLEAAGIMPYWRSRCAPNGAYRSVLESGMGLYIDGRIGAGKTYLAVCIALDCLEAGWSVRLTSMRDVTRMLRATWGEAGVDEESVFDALMRPRVLILDDLGKENMTESVLRDLFDLVDKRKDRELPIIVTTNYSKPELIARMAHGLDDTTTAESIVSRLCEVTQRIPVSGGDRRLA